MPTTTIQDSDPTKVAKKHRKSKVVDVTLGSSLDTTATKKESAEVLDDESYPANEQKKHKQVKDTPLGESKTGKSKKRHRPDNEESGERTKKRKHVTEVPTTENTDGLVDQEMVEDQSVVIKAMNDGASNLEGKKRKKKRKTRVEDSNTLENEQDGDDKVKDKKKGPDIVEEGLEAGRSPGYVADPTNDTTLSDQARKALTYAYAQFHQPLTWKFNKARQNWLIRNIWSEHSIPEIYMTLLLHYLANVQGGVRDTLIRLCRTVIEPYPNPEPADPSAAPVHGDQEVQTVKIDEKTNPARARAVLGALGALSGVS